MTDPGPKKPRKRGYFWRVAFLAFGLVWALILLAVAGGGFVLYMAYDQVTQPGTPGAPVTLTVPQGTTKQGVGALLETEGLIEREAFWRLALRIKPSDTPIQAGVYELARGLSPMQILERLYDGPNRHLNANRFRLTVPEGLSLTQMADLFESPDAFLKAAKDGDLLARLGQASPEGFLMPDTYFFDEVPSEAEAVSRMATQFERAYARLLEEIPGAEAFDQHEIVTVASLVEEEARVDEERPIIASVIYNRLDRGMRLQFDSTLQYALGKYGQRMLDVDKDVDSPYNTYLHAGLPPGPICSPGAASLRAALAPADTDYLYFVSNADGKTHTFSKTLAEHNRAVARYNSEMRDQRRAVQ